MRKLEHSWKLDVCSVNLEHVEDDPSILKISSFGLSFVHQRRYLARARYQGQAMCAILSWLCTCVHAQLRSISLTSMELLPLGQSRSMFHLTDEIQFYSYLVSEWFMGVRSLLSTLVFHFLTIGITFRLRR
jgi:hypothetical protein